MHESNFYNNLLVTMTLQETPSHKISQCLLLDHNLKCISNV